MLQGLRRKLSFANVTSMMALMVALGGTSYAAGLAKNSVGSTQIKPKAVKNSDLGDASVTSKKVENGSLLAADFALGQIPAGPKGATGATGTTGITGATGPIGPRGATGALGAVIVRSETAVADMTIDQKLSYDVYCNAGEQAIGGGGRGDNGDSDLTNFSSSRPAVSTSDTEPPADGNGFAGWRITVKNIGNNLNINPTVWVMCAAAPTP